MERSSPDATFYNCPFSVENFRGMSYRYLGRSGLAVSDIGLGTWKMGYPETGDGSRVNEDAALRILDRSAELGVTFWDTANRYNNASGNSERIIGTWFLKYPKERRNIVLATKMGGTMDGLTPNHCGLSRANILDSVYASLERLQSDYIDLLYFHAFDPNTPPEESLTAIDDLVRQDLVRYFAVSNFDVAQLDLYQTIQEKLTVRSRILAVQNQFDVLNGENPGYPGVLDYAARKGISFIAWSPLVRGLLGGKYQKITEAGPGDRFFDEGQIEKVSSAQLEKLSSLLSLSEAWGIALNQLVIAYMLTMPGMGPVIAASSDVKQLESNALAANIRLSEMQKLELQEVLAG